MDFSDRSKPDGQNSLLPVPARAQLLVASLLAFVSPLILYWSTRYSSITWWETAEYASAAICLGNPHPPGSLLLTLIGWLFTRLPLGVSDILSLNLLAGLLAAATGAMIVLISLKLLESPGPSLKSASRGGAWWIASLGAVLGSLVFTLGETLWIYAIKFTPYVLTALFTSSILWVAVNWWRTADRADAFRWLFMIGLLIGLDFSVHRTNAVLLPGLFVWILILHPRTLTSIRSWMTGITGLLAGLSLHLLIMPIAARQPFLNAGNPETLSQFWDYVSLKQLGGSFLMKFFPRKGAFWGDQVSDFLEAFAANFCTAEGLGLFGWLPLVLGAAGLAFMWQRRRRLAIAFAVLLVVTAAATVFYFNIPADFFRSLHRHYLPCLLTFAVLVAYGGGSLALRAWSLTGRSRPVAVVLTGLLLLALPVSQVMRNFNALDGSRSYFAEDFARNMFAGLEPKAIIIVSGDNDTFPMWFLQVAENHRPDVTVLNMSLLNTSWYVMDQISRDSLLPLSLAEEEIEGLRPRVWTDTTICVAAPENLAGFDLPAGTTVPDSICLAVGPSFENILLISDQILVKMFQENQWRRPFYLAGTAGPSRLPWLQPYLRFEGLVSRAVPLESPPLNQGILTENLINRYSYRGWDKPGVEIESVSRQMALNTCGGFMTLARLQLSAGDNASASETLNALELRLPLDRLQPPEHFRQAIEQMLVAAGN